MKTRSFNLSQDQLDDLVKICEVAKEQAMAEDAAFRLCRRASASALCLPKEAAR